MSPPPPPPTVFFRDFLPPSHPSIPAITRCCHRVLFSSLHSLLSLLCVGGIASCIHKRKYIQTRKNKKSSGVRRQRMSHVARRTSAAACINFEVCTPFPRGGVTWRWRWVESLGLIEIRTHASRMWRHVMHGLGVWTMMMMLMMMMAAVVLVAETSCLPTVSPSHRPTVRARPASPPVQITKETHFPYIS